MADQGAAGITIYCKGRSAHGYGSRCTSTASNRTSPPWAKKPSLSPDGSGSRRVIIVRRPSMHVSIRSFLTMMSSVNGRSRPLDVLDGKVPAVGESARRRPGPGHADGAAVLHPLPRRLETQLAAALVVAVAAQAQPKGLHARLRHARGA